MVKSLFPEEMMNVNVLTLESIASKLTYFSICFQLIHWQTLSFAEHSATNMLYEFTHDFKDEIVEKIIGYSGKKPKAFKIEPLSDNMSSMSLVTELVSFASDLRKYGDNNSYQDVSNMADSLSGTANKGKFLLTLS